MFPDANDGPGIGSQADIEALQKALSIGYSDAQGTRSGFDALRVESLDSTLKLLTWQAEAARLWRNAPMDRAYSTVEEYNLQSSYGSDRTSGFVASGEKPPEQDAQYSRDHELVKYIGTTRAVHHPATLVRTLPANTIAEEVENGTNWMIGQINRGLYYADADHIPEAWNGLIKQIVDGDGHVIDMRGDGFTENTIENAVQLISDHYGQGTRLYSNPKVFSELTKITQVQRRYAAPVSGSTMLGAPVSGMHTQAGDVMFESDIFVTDGGVPPGSASANASNKPDTVALTAQTAAQLTAASQPASFFKTDSDGDNLIYRVTAINKFGESAHTQSGAAVDVVANGGVKIDITPDDGATNDATAFKIYRANSSNGPFKYLTTVKRVAGSTNGALNKTTHYDYGQDIPGTFHALLLDMNPRQSWVFRQLSPMIKMDLAITAPIYSWMQLMYGTPIVFNPKRNIVFKNVAAGTTGYQADVRGPKS